MLGRIWGGAAGRGGLYERKERKSERGKRVHGLVVGSSRRTVYFALLLLLFFVGVFFLLRFDAVKLFSITISIINY